MSSQRISIVSGLCVRNDAISAAAALQAELLADAGYEVRVFVQHLDMTQPPLRSDGSSWDLQGTDPTILQVRDSWTLQQSEFFRTSDLIVYHLGIHFDLFNSLLLAHPTARTAVYFHNITPPLLLRGGTAIAASQAMDQAAIATFADMVWAVSEHNADVLAELSDVERSDVIVIPLSVHRHDLARPLVDDPVASTNPGSAATDGTTRVLAVGRMVAAKGQLDLLEAVVSIPPPARERFSLELVGSRVHSDPAYIRDLEGFVDAHRLEAQVQLLFDPSDEELWESYRRADVFVSPSHHEGFCVPVVEALMAGCRVITTDAGALPSTVGPCGTVVPVSDPEALASALLRAQRAGPLDAAESATVRRHLEQFSPDTYRSSLLDAVRVEIGPP